ncbi:BnaC05g23250D [Brassica napus]|uniref:BnaC05g23250D protein n=1 Tax=Brassica napus TaxID=3708 RepID=A0A078F9C2_BRANA|nr:BnaC05g23250D [Brassica napus]
MCERRCLSSTRRISVAFGVLFFGGSRRWLEESRWLFANYLGGYLGRSQSVALPSSRIGGCC